MRKTFFQRLTFLLLAAVLVVGLIPLTFAHAAVTDGSPPTAETIPKDTGQEATDPPQTSAGGGGTMTGTEFTLSQSEIMPLALGDSHRVSASVTGYIFPKSGYTYEYPDEDGNMVTHSLDHITLWRANGYYMYCLQPPVDTNGGYTGTEVDGNAVWANLSGNQQRLVGLTLLYGCPNRLDPASTEDSYGHGIWMQGATQAVVWEIVLGYRDTTTGELLDSTIKDAFSGNPAFSEDGKIADFKDPGNMKNYYNQLEAALTRHMIHLSFTSTLAAKAPTITVTDTNGVLEDYTFTDGNGLTFQTSGNDLTITADASFTDTKLVAPTNDHIPNLETSVFILWQGNSGNAGGQVQVSVAEAGTDPVPVYFKVRLAVGTLKIVKGTNTGTDLTGWQFGVYTDSACTQAVEGSPFTSGEDGTIAANLAPGTYYVKELGSRPGWLMDTEVKEVTVQPGETATATFTNTQLGGLKIIKTSEDGIVAGHTFRITGDGYDKTFTTTGTNGTNATDAEGLILVNDLLPGTYTVTEILPPYSPYEQPSSKTVTVDANRTTPVEVKFYNRFVTYDFDLYKTCEDGNVEGFKFRIQGLDGLDFDETYTTDEDGEINTRKKRFTFFILHVKMVF